METLGIENLKKAVKFAIDLGEQFAESAKDGFTWKDSFSFIDELLQVPGLLSRSKDIVAELKDLSEVEKEELVAWAKDELDLEDDALEAKVEGALEFALQFLKFYSLFKKPTAEVV